MKKLLVSILLTLVVGVGAFAKVYIATKDPEKTLEKAFSEPYQKVVKGSYEEWIDMYSDSEFEDFTYLVYFDTTKIKVVRIYTRTSSNDSNCKIHTVEIITDKGKIIGLYGCSIGIAIDPVLVGLYFLNEEVCGIFDVYTGSCLGCFKEIK